ncbi:germ cell nuclear acidic protein isoform X2 [Rhincodon typus]|uniref:germ cell nuclear acidic protein isoform X2 n=1 Tax=Rhincodon typus TaxID=259920 RepID=UPI00202F52DD|nr:germ cell nuclear acidic protein isoform X2 [Rhincodon typus]
MHLCDYWISMDEETRSRFQRVAGRLGWTEYGDLNAIEAQLQERITNSLQSNCKDTAMNLESELGESPNTDDSCVCKLLLSSSEDEAKSRPEITLESWQDRALTKKVCEKLQSRHGTIVISDSSDNDFETCSLSDLIRKRALNSDFKAGRTSKTRNIRSSEPSTDSSGDEDYEKFLARVKTPKMQPERCRAWRENDNSLKDFIVSDDLSSDDLDINGTVEKEHSANIGSMSLEGGSSSNRPTYTKKLNELSHTSDTSSDEFESLFQRIKNKTKRTPDLISSHLNGRMAITEPVKQKPSHNRLGAKHKSRDKKSFDPISTQASQSVKGVLSELTSLSQVPDFNLLSFSESQSQRPVSRQCQMHGCFLHDLTLGSSKYVKNFKQNRDELTQELYDLYNKSVFQQKLPEKLVITWNKKMRKTAGYCVTGQKRDGTIKRYARIELSEKVCDSAERLRDTLIHELCHAATWLINNVRDGHGPFWKLYAQRSILIHPELPMVTRCHTYEINYKYTYQCNKCKNTIGRHSKSLDTQRFVCALCTGPLVLLTKMLKDGTPAKKDLAPFAKFVKENYSSTKREHKGLQHADVMRQLSADFAKKTQITDF